MVKYTERKTVPPVGMATRMETIYSENEDDYSTVFEIASGIVVEESQDDRAYIYWYDATGTFDEVVADIESDRL